MNAEVALGLLPHRHSFRKVVSFFFGIPPDERRVLLHLMKMIRDAVLVIEDLRQPIQTARMRRSILRSQDRLGCGFDGFFQRDGLVRFQCKNA